MEKMRRKKSPSSSTDPLEKLDLARQVLASSNRYANKLKELERNVMIELGNACMVMSRCVRNTHDLDSVDKGWKCKYCGLELKSLQSTISETAVREQINKMFVKVNRLHTEFLTSCEKFGYEPSHRFLRFENKYISLRNHYSPGLVGYDFFATK